MVMGLAMLDKGKHFPQSYARMLFSAVGIHQDGQLLITIDPWDERRARELMQEELMLRLYNHVYADPVYWNNLGLKIASFSWHPLLRSLNRMLCFADRQQRCSTASARRIRFWIKCKYCCHGLQGVIRMSSLNTSAGGWAKCGVSVCLR